MPLDTAAPPATAATGFDAAYQLGDRYTRTTGRVFLTGTQALVRILLDQRARDRAAGLTTAGFVSGYRGSPLGGLDQELWRLSQRLTTEPISFLPAINEDLAATAVLGSQQVETDPAAQVQGVFAMWYGKGPGVDRSGDALKHGNAYGSSPHGGVLVVAGDDHGCVSSSMPHQSDVAFISWFMPCLHPASVAEYLTFGEWGYALSRYSGMWVGFKAISETVESAQSVELRPPRRFILPPLGDVPPGGLHYRWPDLPGPQIEHRLVAKKAAVLAFAEANPIDHALWGHPARYGIVTTGKAHLDLMEALRLLGIDRAEAARIGLDVFKVGMVWPLAHDRALTFVTGKQEVLVVEEKRGIIESQLKEYFYDHPGRLPERMVGKATEHGQPLVPWVGELSPTLLAGIVARRLDALWPELNLTARAARLEAAPAAVIQIAGATRTPYFCSGCPHNTSTRVPEGSKALAGIGCHFMASWMDRNTESLIQMGGEGVNWVALSRFNGGTHVFQNLGEGTFYHSGSMAIRQAVAGGANITFKILFNDAVAMTGGQPVDGPITVEAIAQMVRAEGVERIAILSEEPARIRRDRLPAGVTVEPRDRLDARQRELREIPGVTVLIYDQGCATEKRRKRKRGQLPEPARRVVINPAVCEGCGDCSVASNCLSVEPLETPLGRKRRINQASCNKDYSCLGGFCPSFVTVEGVELARRAPALSPDQVAARATALPHPAGRDLSAAPYDLLVTGVGGTGVITVGAVIAMAAHLEGKGASVLDFMGFAQKFGPVLSYLRLAATPDQIHQVRIDQAQADAVIGCDLVVSTEPKASRTYRRGATRMVLNTTAMPTGDFVRRRDADLAAEARTRRLAEVVGRDALIALPANDLAERLLGDPVFANVLLMGAAWQQGLIPVGLGAMLRALELNGVAVAQNQAAFTWGRLAVADPAAVREALGAEADPLAVAAPESLETRIARWADHLAGWGSPRLVRHYRDLVGRVQAAERALGTVADGQPLTEAVAFGLMRVMAYKDEYEVARLHSDPAFAAQLAGLFGPGVRPRQIRHHLAPPLLPTGRDARGRPNKVALPGWLIGPAFALLRRAKRLRGTVLDPFGWTAERRAERALARDYAALAARLAAEVTADTHAQAVRIARLVQEVRGFGPVKEAALARYHQDLAAALADWPHGHARPAAAA